MNTSRSTPSMQRSQTGPDRAGKRAGSGNRVGRSSPTKHRRHGTALPSWTDLEPKNNRPYNEPDQDSSFLRDVSTVRFGLLVIVIAALFTLYVGHVHATQQVLMDVQEARQLNHTLHLKHNRLKGEFDQATGPAVVYDRARELGLRESVPTGRKVVVDE